MSTGNVGTIKRSGSLRFDPARFRRNINKHISRTKEKVLHNLDKGEKTDDEFIKKSETILIKKQTSTVKLQTELKRHLKALKNISASSRSLHETMLEAYEDSWAGRKEFADALANLDSSWLHYFNTLCTVLEQVGSHVDEFVTLKEKLEKRKRKLVDYNLAKRNLYLLTSAKKRDEGKLKKAKRETGFMETAYHSLNRELRNDLPQFYDSHVHFCCENWSYLMESEKRMYEHLISTAHQFISSLDQLRTGYQNSEYQLRDIDLSYSDINRSSLSLSVDSSSYANGDLGDTYDFIGDRRGSVDLHHHSKTLGVRGVQRHSSSANPDHFMRSELRPEETRIRTYSLDDLVGDDADGYGIIAPSGATKPPVLAAVAPTVKKVEPVEDAEDYVYAELDKTKKISRQTPSTACLPVNPDHSASPFSVKTDDMNASLSIKNEDSTSNTSRSSRQIKKGMHLKSETSGGASSTSSSMSSRHHSTVRSNNDSPQAEKTRRTENLPLRMATHPYISQDEDELDLAVNDLVQVLPWENESLKEDGWLFGMKLPDSRKGLFPENHTIVFVT